jgi:hypothetical protein
MLLALLVVVALLAQFVAATAHVPRQNGYNRAISRSRSRVQFYGRQDASVETRKSATFPCNSLEQRVPL